MQVRITLATLQDTFKFQWNFNAKDALNIVKCHSNSNYQQYHDC